jgi:hypothetical protein
LDFDGVEYFTEREKGRLAVEVSYREEVVDEPDLVMVGPPYYDPFEIPVLKFELVKQGNYRGRIEETVDALAGEYAETLPGLDPEGPFLRGGQGDASA